MIVLYITYDGILDPLGESQILPYIKGISCHQDKVIVLSFEKPKRILNGYESISEQMNDFGIQWNFISFTSSFGLLGKAWDLLRMYCLSCYLTYKHNVKIVHARSHLPTQIGLFLKRIFGVKLIFDFRGLWVDERVDKGGWDLNRLSHRMQFNYFKSLEKKMLAKSNKIFVLTRKVVDEVVRLSDNSDLKVTVIPCCADFDHFKLSTSARKNNAKNYFNIPIDAFVYGYLGSVGNMYMLDRFFRLFTLAAKHDSKCHAVLITQDVFAAQKLMKSYLSKKLFPRIHIKSANRKEIINILPAMDIMISFVLPSYARISMSPTKIAECFSAGIPIVSNPGIGDVKEIVEKINGGVIVDPFLDDNLMKIVNKRSEIALKGGVRLRNVARPMLGLELANMLYKSVYKEL